MHRINPAALQPGKPWPLGAHWDGQGVNLAVFSAHASAIDWCLFDPESGAEVHRLRLRARSGDVWHGYLPDACPGLVYGLRAHGLWRPEQGHTFDASKLLLDPYAREIVGDFIWRDEHFAPDRQHPRHLNTHDNARLALKARLPDPKPFDWGDDQPPALRPQDWVIYECHVKGLTRLHPHIPPALRGTYAGLAHPACLDHLQQLGVTVVNLLPVHYSLSEERLMGMGLSNYWGYNTLGFFCPNPNLASGQGGLSVLDEFKSMVRALHQRGIAVILDVVYNHTAEAGAGGPTISWRGLDNASYYRLDPNDRAQYENHSGCGNTLDLRHPRVLQMVMDSLRYWVSECHVDGFRFDLATVLGRTDTGFSARAPFFMALAQDPLLCRVAWIAEPWDIGPGGYQVGGFGDGWLEWNDQFRDAMRRFWVQGAAQGNGSVEGGTRADFAMRLCASSDIFQPHRRTPMASVNYVVSHDGFTLRDLLSYNHRHNLANGEDNRDGTGNNLSFNCGVEGDSDAPVTLRLRARLQRALLASVLLSQGTPMISAGDELGHTQHGNNNPYCQDNATTWIGWDRADADLLAYTRHVLQLRRGLWPLGDQWYSGLADERGVYDLSWWNADGTPLQGPAWHDRQQRCLKCLIGKPGGGGAPLLLLVNGSASPTPFALPRGAWRAVLDSSHPQGLAQWQASDSTPLPVAAYSLVLLQKVLRGGF
ncbi:MAG: glycogen debranching protein GlgX [Rhodoferax sp.]